MSHDQINAVINACNAAVLAGDMDAILANYEPTGALVGEPGMIATGTSALREAFSQFIALHPQITALDHDVIVTGDIALHSSTWNMTGKTPDGSPFEQSGFSMVVLRKQANGAWLIAIDNPFADHLVRKS